MPRLTNSPKSKNFADITASNPYIDRLIRILMSPITSRQSTDMHDNGLNPGYDDPHRLLEQDAKLTHKQILQMLMDNTLMNDLHQSHVKGEPLYEGLADPTYPYPNR